MNVHPRRLSSTSIRLVVSAGGRGSASTSASGASWWLAGRDVGAGQRRSASSAWANWRVTSTSRSMSAAWVCQLTIAGRSAVFPA